MVIILLTPVFEVQSLVRLALLGINFFILFYVCLNFHELWHSVMSTCLNTEVMQQWAMFNLVLRWVTARAATILRLLGNETIQYNTRGKKSEPGL